MAGLMYVYCPFCNVRLEDNFPVQLKECPVCKKDLPQTHVDYYLTWCVNLVSRRMKDRPDKE